MSSRSVSAIAIVPRFVASAILMVLTLALACSVAQAQTASANLSGVVEDQNGAVVPGANVSAVNPATTLQRQTTTNDQGYFTIPLLPPGTYVIRIEAQGFTPLETRDVILNVGDQKALRIATVVDRQFVANLPLNGRSFQSLILLTPGVVVTVAGGGNVGQFSVNGQRSNANYFTVDGVSANSGISFLAGGSGDITSLSQQFAGTVPALTALGTTQGLVSIDALEEFRVQTSTYSAEFGRQPGGQVQLVTRSGTNQFHGTAFNYLRNEVFDANDWFANSAGLKRAPLRQNNFGGTFSGPMMLPRFGQGGRPYWNGRNRTFFFFSYEGLRLLLPTSATRLVPSLRLRGIAPSALQPILNAFPKPTGSETFVGGVPSGMAPITASYSSPKSMDATSIRIDHNVSSKLILFGRYSDTPSNSLTRTLSFVFGDKNIARSLTLGSTFSPSQRLSNEFRFNYSRNRSRNSFSWDNFGGAIPIDSSLLVSGYSGPGIKFGRIGFLFSGGGLAPGIGDMGDEYQRQINIVDNVSLTSGVHQLRFGIDYRRLAPIFGPVAYSQTTFFFSQADVLSGTASSVSINASQGARPLFDNYSFYGQDVWKPSPRLTVDLGLRWELNPPPRDANGLKPVLVTGVEHMPTAVLAPPNTPLYKTFHTAFAPRVGAAYQLNQGTGRETLLRAGFGVYYDLGNGQAINGFSTYPFKVSKRLSRVAYPISAVQAQPPGFPAVTLPITADLYAVSPSLKLPYTLQWNVALSQSLGKQQTVTLSYVASAARRLLTTQLVNSGAGFVGPPPNPNFGLIFYTSNGPTSDFNSLQAQFSRRLSRGLQAQVNYTWSHAIDEVSDELGNQVLERGNADFDVRHNFTGAVTYNIPKLRRLRVLAPVLRDWAVDSTLYVQSGRPINLFSGQIVRADGTVLLVRPDVFPGLPFWIKDSEIPGGRRINSAAFRSPPLDQDDNPTRQGSLGRNVVRVPGLYQLNVSIRRKFNLTERLNLQIKADVFNLLNHPLFGNYDLNVLPGYTNTGVPSSMLNQFLGGLNPLYQLGGSRSMQFSIRLSF